MFQSLVRVRLANYPLTSAATGSSERSILYIRDIREFVLSGGYALHLLPLIRVHF